MQNTLAQLLPWLLILAVFYMFMILPEQKKQKKVKEMLNNLMVGDKVMTRGGVIGTILTLTDDSVVIESGPSRMKIEFARYAVSSVLESRAEKYNIKNEDKKEDKKEEYTEVKGEK